VLTESAKILSIEEDWVCLEAQNTRHCSACSAHASCGHRLLSKLHPDRGRQIKVRRNEFKGQSGDTATIGIDEKLVLRLSVMFYLMPLLSMITVMLIADIMGIDDYLVILSALAGLILGIVGLGRITKKNIFNSRYQAILLPQLKGTSKNA
jgi:sigma-E factor negative regulatory protein RseC